MNPTEQSLTMQQQKSADIYSSWHSFAPVLALDLFVVIALGVFTLLLQLDIIEPNMRGFFVNDTSIYYPRTPGRVSTPALFVYGFIFPLVIVIIFGIRDGAFKSLPRFRFFLHQVIILAFIAICNVFVTNSLKTMVGRHRPDFIARCIPDYTKIQPDPVSTYVSIEACTGEHKAILEGHKSFPSGHSSQAMVGATYIAIYLYRRLPNIFRGRLTTQQFRLAAGIIPMCGGMVIAASRSIDNRHHALDIIFGGIIGVLCGLFLLSFGPLTYPGDVETETPIDMIQYQQLQEKANKDTNLQSYKLPLNDTMQSGINEDYDGANARLRSQLDHGSLDRPLCQSSPV